MSFNLSWLDRQHTARRCSACGFCRISRHSMLGVIAPHLGTQLCSTLRQSCNAHRLGIFLFDTKRYRHRNRLPNSLYLLVLRSSFLITVECRI